MFRFSEKLFILQLCAEIALFVDREIFLVIFQEGFSFGTYIIVSLFKKAQPKQIYT